MIAVNMLYGMPQVDELQFQKELTSLMRFQHPNIVQLVGYCYEIYHILVKVNGEHVFEKFEEKALCFEYSQQGSLDKHLCGKYGDAQ